MRTIDNEELDLVNGGKGPDWGTVTAATWGLVTAAFPEVAVPAAIVVSGFSFAMSNEASTPQRNDVTDPMSGQVVGHGGASYDAGAGRHNGSDNYNPGANAWDLRGGGDQNSGENREHRLT